MQVYYYFKLKWNVYANLFIYSLSSVTRQIMYTVSRSLSQSDSLKANTSHSVLCRVLKALSGFILLMTIWLYISPYIFIYSDQLKWTFPPPNIPSQTSQFCLWSHRVTWVKNSVKAVTWGRFRLCSVIYYMAGLLWSSLQFVSCNCDCWRNHEWWKKKVTQSPPSYAWTNI